jgi:PEP-CTERM motif
LQSGETGDEEFVAGQQSQFFLHTRIYSMRQSFSLVSALVVIALFAGTASAGPLVDFTLLGSTSANGPFTSSLTVTSGEKIFYELEVTLAPIGSTNGTHTITSKVDGVDGVNALSLNITSGSAIPTTFTAGTFQNSWNSIIGETPGTPSEGGLSDIRGGQSPGVFVGANSESIALTGSFTTGASLGSGLTSLVSMDFGGATSGIKINDGTIVFMSANSEGGSDPVAGFTGLTIMTASAAVPEPSSVVLMGLSTMVIGGVMAARRRNRKAQG